MAPDRPDYRVSRVGVLLGLISALSTVTALRLPGQVGPAEVLGVVWCAGVWIRMPVVRGRYSFIALTLLTIATLGALGRLAAEVFGWVQGDLGFLTLAALVLSLVILFTVERHGPVSILHSWAGTFGVASILIAAISYFAPETFSSALGFTSTGAGTSRFSGYTNNPNQLAGFMVAANCALVTRWWRGWRIGLLIVLVAVSSLIILATDSDSGRIALLGSAAALVIFAAVTNRSISLRFLSLGVVIGLVTVFWQRLAASYDVLIPGPLRTQGDQLGVRQNIWSRCWETLGDNPLLGTGSNQALVGNVGSSFQECHNFFVEAGVVGGLVPLVATSVAVVALAYLIYRSHNSLVMAGLVGVVIFQFGNSSVRFPLFWLLLAAIYWSLQRAMPSPQGPRFGQLDSTSSDSQQRVAPARTTLQ